MSEVAHRIEREVGPLVRTGLRGASLTTFAIGGELERLAEPDTPQQAMSLVRILKSEAQAFRLLGAGSNLVIPSAGVPGWTIRLGRGFRSVAPLGGARFRVGGACGLMTLSRDLSEAGFGGLEFCAGIPASFGGAVWMNAGAHGSQMAEVLEEVTYVSPDGDLSVAVGSELGFGYRRTSLPAGCLIVAGVVRLVEGDPGRIRQRRNAFLEERRKKQPLQLPSAGSVFRNPSEKEPAGQLIERAGLKGRAVGGAEISSLHANWIVNPKRRASDGDVIALVEVCRREVSRQFGVALEPEIVFWR